MAKTNIIDIVNDMARNIGVFDVFDQNSMNTRTIRPKIIVGQFKFKPIMF